MTDIGNIGETGSRKVVTKSIYTTHFSIECIMVVSISDGHHDPSGLTFDPPANLVLRLEGQIT